MVFRGKVRVRELRAAVRVKWLSKSPKRKREAMAKFSFRFREVIEIGLY